MSQKNAPNLCNVLLTFSTLEKKLSGTIRELEAFQSTSSAPLVTTRLVAGLEAGLTKLKKYQSLAQESDLCLIATGTP